MPRLIAFLTCIAILLFAGGVLTFGFAVAFVALGCLGAWMTWLVGQMFVGRQ
jgi:hypothetical protein